MMFLPQFAILKFNWKAYLIEPVVGYTRFVFATKFILVFLAIIMACLLIVLPLVNPLHQGFRMSFNSDNTELENLPAPEAPTMVEPHFQGVDENKRPFNIIADKAIRQTQDMVVLVKPSGELAREDDGWVTASSDQGVLSMNSKTLDLIDNVTILASEGYEIYTNSAHISMEENSAYGSEPVEAVGPAGHLNAQSFMVEDKGGRVIFQGGVKLVFYPAYIEKSNSGK